jgi:hypothetical protein
MIISFGFFQVYWGIKYFPSWFVINGAIHDFTCPISSVPFRLDCITCVSVFVYCNRHFIK